MPAPNRHVEGYDYVIGASDLGRCIRASVADLLGYSKTPTPEGMQELYDKGHAHEEACLAQMRADGWSLRGFQEERVLHFGNAAVIVHPDAIGQTPTTVVERIIEIKSPSTWQSFERAVRTNVYTDPYMHRIAWQVSVQMASQHPLEAIIACFDDSIIRYFGIERAPFTFNDIEARVAEIMGWVEHGQLPPCSQDDYPCPFFPLHPPKDEPETDPALEKLASEDQFIAGMIREWEAKRKRVRARLDEALGDRKTVLTGGYRVSRVDAERVTIDWKAAESSGVDLTPYKKVTTSSSLRVTTKGASSSLESSPESESSQ